MTTFPSASVDVSPVAQSRRSEGLASVVCPVRLVACERELLLPHGMWSADRCTALRVRVNRFSWEEVGGGGGGGG